MFGYIDGKVAAFRILAARDSGLPAENAAWGTERFLPQTIRFKNLF
jgi:hypothetical protein